MDLLLPAVSCGISLLAVCVSFYAVWSTNRMYINSGYYSDMAKAYSEYLGAVAAFVYEPDGKGRLTVLSAALYRVSLFATPEIFSQACFLHDVVLQWAQGPRGQALVLDTETNRLRGLMQEHLRTFVYRPKRTR